MDEDTKFKETGQKQMNISRSERGGYGKTKKQRQREIFLSTASCWQICKELLSRFCRKICRGIRRFFRFLLSCCRWILPGIPYDAAGECTKGENGQIGREDEILFLEENDQQIRDLQSRLCQKEQIIDDLNQEKTQFENRLCQKEQIIYDLNQEKTQFENRLFESQGVISQLQARFDEQGKYYRQESENYKSSINQLHMELKEAKAKKDDALSRLSELMGAKLKDNNPAIADLNDQNRPMKLGEQFSELYENEWTDAYVLLLDLKNEDDSAAYEEKIAVQVLLTILKEINNYCIEDVQNQLGGLFNCVQSIPKEDSKDYIKTVKDTQKKHALLYIPLIQKKILEDDKCLIVSKHRPYCQTYIEGCVKLCYLSAVQDPPMYLDFNPGDVYDKQTFKEYTATGTRVKFLVWPALFLHQGGPLLAKGVVQPMNGVE